MLHRISLVSLCLVMVTLSLTGLQLGTATAQTRTFGCTETFKAFRSAINAHDKHLMKYAAFARGRAFTITGMKGCGWAHGKKSQAEADRVAMEKCRKAAKNPDKCYIALRYKD